MEISVSHMSRGVVRLCFAQKGSDIVTTIKISRDQALYLADRLVSAEAVKKENEYVRRYGKSK